MLTSEKRSVRNPKKAAGNGRHSSLSRSNHGIRSSRTACRVVSPRLAAVYRIIQATGWTCLSVAIIEDGDRFFSRSEEYVTADYAEYIILRLYKLFEDVSTVALDGVPYFLASVVTATRSVTTLHSSRFRRIRRNRIQSERVDDGCNPSQQSVLRHPRRVTNTN